MNDDNGTIGDTPNPAYGVVFLIVILVCSVFATIFYLGEWSTVEVAPSVPVEVWDNPLDVNPFGKKVITDYEIVVIDNHEYIYMGGPAIGGFYCAIAHRPDCTFCAKEE